MQLLHSMKSVVVLVVLFVVFLSGILFESFTQKIFTYNSSPLAMEISRQIEVSTNVLPNTFYSRPTFSASDFLGHKTELNDEDKAIISDIFAKILKRVSQEDFCTGGSYDVYPIYNYSGDNNDITGHRLNSYLECKITQEQIETYNTLLRDIDSILKDYKYISLNIPALNMSLSTQEIRNHKEKLYNEIFLKAEELALEYSQRFKKDCEIYSLFFGDQEHIAPRQAEILKSTSTAHAPIVKEKEIALSASVIFACK